MYITKGLFQYECFNISPKRFTEIQALCVFVIRTWHTATYYEILGDSSTYYEVIQVGQHQMVWPTHATSLPKQGHTGRKHTPCFI